MNVLIRLVPLGIVLSHAPWLSAQGDTQATSTEVRETLLEARRGFSTHLRVDVRQNTPFPAPPPELFSVVEYEAPLGKNLAYLSPVANGETGRPAIVWITGGFPPARGGAYVWQSGPLDNDQSATAYRDAGVLMMFPTVRGTCQNPGSQEWFFGEVDDVIAAGQYLAKLPQVDPKRIYLGGHSSGGTLALLVAEVPHPFRAVFSFGPVGELADHGERDWSFDPSDPREFRLRSPLHFLESIRSPTFVFEGQHGNSEDLRKLREHCTNPRVRMVELPGADHYSLLTPINRFLAGEVLRQREGPFELDMGAIPGLYKNFWRGQREARDLRLIADLRAQGAQWGAAHRLDFRLRGRTLERMSEVGASLKVQGFDIGDPVSAVDEDGDPLYRVTVMRTLPFEVPAIFLAAQSVAEAVERAQIVDEGWTATAAQKGH